MISRAVVAVLVVLYSAGLFAAPADRGPRNGHENNGGNLQVVQFISTARDIHRYLSTATGENRLLSDTELKRFAATIDETRVEPVMDGLVDRRGQRADAVVVDDELSPGHKKIRIWEPAWRQYLSGVVTRGVYILVFHEYLRVMGFREDQQILSNRLNMGSGELPRLTSKAVNLSFEPTNMDFGGVPFGWQKVGTAEYNVVKDTTIVRGGMTALRVENSYLQNFGGVGQCLPAEDLKLRALVLRGFIKTNNVIGIAGLWLRIDGIGGQTLFLDNMYTRGINGTLDWFEVGTNIARVPSTATMVCFGTLMSGSGTAWFDELKLEIQ